MKLKNVVRFASQSALGVLRDFKIDIPKPVPADESTLVERIRASFLAMKTSDHPNWCDPSKEWQRQLDRYPMKDMGYFLANFGISPIYTGIEETGYWAVRLRHAPWYVKEVFFHKPFEVWKSFRQSIERLAFPRYGNQVGAWKDGHFIGPGLFNDIIGLQISRLVDGPIAELGGGYGKLAWCVLRDVNVPYVDFDLPETLCTAAYFLGKAFPNKRILLYGERPFGQDCFEDFDLIFMPPWEIEKLKSVSVFFNKNSLGEMSPHTAQTNLKHIGRCSKWFFHMNHETNRFGDALLAHEYEVPMRLIYKSPEIGHLAGYGIPDIWQYLYH